MTARELRRERLERAGERLAELEAELAHTQLALAKQLEENSALTQRAVDLQANADQKQVVVQERKALLSQIMQAARAVEALD